MSSDEIDEFNSGVIVEWFDSARITKAQTPKGYESMLGYIKSKRNDLGRLISSIHYEFGSDVGGLNQDKLLPLLNFQKDINVQLVEIPNTPDVRNYSELIDFAVAWRKANAVDKPVMGIVTDVPTVDIILNKKDQLDCCGLNLRRSAVPLLGAAREKLKNEKIWTHAFSVPRTYRKVDFKGTLGILNNFYGIDSFNHYSAPPKVSQKFFFEMEEKSDDEKIAEAQSGKIFNPLDYGSPVLSTIENQYGPDHELSNFCNCTVCKKNTIGTMLSDYEMTYINTRAHQNLSNLIETKEFRKKVNNDEAEEYIDSKEFARRIIG